MHWHFQVVGQVTQVNGGVVALPLRRRHGYQPQQTQEATNDAAVLVLALNTARRKLQHQVRRGDGTWR